MSRRNLSLLIAALLASLVCYHRGRQNPYARYVADGFELIDDTSLDPPANEELVAGAMRGMVDVLRRRGDEHSRFLMPREAKQLLDELSGGFGGVGVRIRQQGEPPQLVVVGPPEPGSPASRGGVRAGDRILAIDGEPTVGMTMGDVLEKMRGRVGDAVMLSIGRGEPGSPAVEARLVREVISVPSVIGDRRLADGAWRHLLEQDPRVALVRVQTFGDRTTTELQRLIPDLLDRGMRAMVLDLRDNAGGSLDASIEVCNLFLPPGAPIVETRGRDGRLVEEFVASGGPFIDFPLVVLVNGSTASASEITAACLQDNQRAVVVGERSFGKGTVQRVLPVGPDEAILKLTIASFWRPSGENIHRGVETPEDDAWGVSPTPGFEVPLDDEEYAAYVEVRSQRDLMPVEPSAPEGMQGGIANSDAAVGETSGHEAGADKTQADFADPVLDRAVEHLQSLLDASL